MFRMKLPLAKLVAALSILILACSVTEPANASALVVYHSATTNGYGWCSRGTLNGARSCAEDYCTKGGNTDCKQVLECSPTAWGAIAWQNNDVTAFAASCGLSDKTAARKVALSSCMAAAHDFCWLTEAFDSRRDYNSDQDTHRFAMTWYAQMLLNGMGFDAGVDDAVLGRKTRAAIKQFQADLGREQTGELDDELILRMADGFGGAAEFTSAVTEAIVTPQTDIFSELSYSEAQKPAPDSSVGEALNDLTEKQQLMRLATILSVNDEKCTLPALSATSTSPGSMEHRLQRGQVLHRLQRRRLDRRQLGNRGPVFHEKRLFHKDPSAGHFAKGCCFPDQVIVRSRSSLWAGRTRGTAMLHRCWRPQEDGILTPACRSRLAVSAELG